MMVHLYKATSAEDAYAIRLGEDASKPWEAEKGLGQDFQKVWTVELQSDRCPDAAKVDWEAVLGRVMEAYDLSDPLISDFQWPVKPLA